MFEKGILKPLTKEIATAISIELYGKFFGNGIIPLY